MFKHLKASLAALVLLCAGNHAVAEPDSSWRSVKEGGLDHLRVQVFYETIYRSGKKGWKHEEIHLSDMDKNRFVRVMQHLTDEYLRIINLTNRYYEALHCDAEGDLNLKRLESIKKRWRAYNASAYTSSWNDLGVIFGIEIYDEIEGMMMSSSKGTVYKEQSVADSLAELGWSIDEYITNQCANRGIIIQ